MAVRYVSTARYASIFGKKYSTLVRYAFFVMVRVRYVGMVRFKNWTEVRYAWRCEVLSMQILDVPYRTAILGCRWTIALSACSLLPNVITYACFLVIVAFPSVNYSILCICSSSVILARCYIIIITRSCIIIVARGCLFSFFWRHCIYCIHF